LERDAVEEEQKERDTVALVYKSQDPEYFGRIICSLQAEDRGYASKDHLLSEIELYSRIDLGYSTNSTSF
jgi:hypothetical protein